MTPIVAPWLQVSPADFGAAAAKGAALTEQGREANQRAAAEMAAISQHAAAASQQASLERQRLAQSAKQSQMEMQAQQEQQQRDFLLKQQQDKTLNAYRQAEIGLRNDAINREEARSANVLASRMGYGKTLQEGIAAGKSYDEAAREAFFKFPGVTGVGEGPAMKPPAAREPKSLPPGSLTGVEKLEYQSAQKDMAQAQKDLENVGNISGWFGGRNEPQQRIDTDQRILNRILASVRTRDEANRQSQPTAGVHFVYDKKLGKAVPVQSQTQDAPPATAVSE